MPKEESTKSNVAEPTRTGRSWSTGVIAGVAAAGLGLLVAAGIGGAAIGQAVDHSQRDKPGSSEMRDHGKDGRQGGRDGAPQDGPGMQGPGMNEPGSVSTDPNAPPAPGDEPVTGQSPSEPSEKYRDRGDRPDRDRGDRPPRMG